MLASLLLFFPALQVGFLSDDFHMLSLSATQDVSFFQYFTTNLEGTTVGSSYGPVFRLWWKGMYELFGNNPLPYHIFMILLHGLATYLVGTFVWGTAKKKDLAVASAALFLVLQSRAEPVMWIASFPHLFATVCILGSIIAWQKFLSSRKKNHYAISLCAWVVALWTKEVAITVPAIWLLLIFFQTKPWREKLLASLKFLTLPLALSICYLLLRTGATGQLAGYNASAAGVPLGTMIQTSFDVLVGTWLPIELRRVVVLWFMTHPVATLLSIAALILILKQTAQKYTALFVAMSWIVLIPFTQILLHPLTQEGERYTYLVSAFFVPAIVFFFRALLPKRRRFFAVVAAIAALQLYWLVPKQQTWTVASTKTEQIITSAQELSLQESDHVVLIGFPDNYLGAQMLRNAAGVALGIPVQERIPQYVGYKTAESLTADIEQVGDMLIIYPKQPGIKEPFPIPVATGFPIWQGAYTSSTITNFSRLGNRGKKIEISLHKAKIEQDITSQEQDFVILFVDDLQVTELVRSPAR